MNKREYPEEYVLLKVINSSPEFKNYYDNERSKISKSLKWFEDINISTNSENYSSVHKDVDYIFLKRIPALTEDAKNIAYLMHGAVLRQYYKLPHIAALERFKVLSLSINHSIHNPIIKRTLLKYKFNLVDDFANELKNNRKELEQKKYTRIIGDTLTHWSIKYANSVIEYELISIEYEYKDESYFNWFKSVFPTVALESAKIANEIRKVDLYSNKSIKNYFNWIIANYNLNSKVMII